MLSAFLISLREGLEAALVVGICLVYLSKIGRRDLKRPVWYGVAAALALSGVAAYLLERFTWNQESAEGVLMLVAAALLVSMIVWMRRVARTLRGSIEGKVDALVGESAAALGLFLFVFAMVLREGIETVIFLSALSFNAQGVPLIAGTALGLAAAVGVGVFFFRGALPVPLARFFSATSLMLVVITVQLVLSGLHELSEGEVIPSGPWMMRILGPVVRNEIFFFVVLLATAAWLVGRELLQRRPRAAERRWMAAGVATALVALVVLTAEHIYARGSNGLPDALPVQAASDNVRIPLDWVNDGALHRFRFTYERTSIRFFVITRPDGQLAVRLEACAICGAHPYFRDGDAVVCQNCAASIPLAFLDTPGGCNPVKVDSQVEGGELVIPLASLLNGERFFLGQSGSGIRR